MHALLPPNSKKKSAKKRRTLRAGNYIPLSHARKPFLKLENASSGVGHHSDFPIWGRSGSEPGLKTSP